MKSTGDRQLRVLRVDASGQLAGSSTRTLLDYLLTALEGRYGNLAMQNRDLAKGIPHVDHEWIDANLTPPGNRSSAQHAALELSDSLVEELKSSDVVAIGVPVYNFGVPAALKAWVDMIARARLTFRYSDQGPVGLLQGKKAILVVASGGVAVDSEGDFATPYMRQALRFLGITDIVVVAADQQIKLDEDAIINARAGIDEIVRKTEFLSADARVA